MIPGKVWRACQSEVIYLKGGHQFLGLAIPALFLLRSNQVDYEK